MTKNVIPYFKTKYCYEIVYGENTTKQYTNPKTMILTFSYYHNKIKLHKNL